MKKFRKVGVGGTFDELHKGHKVLLIKAFEISERVTIGLCTDGFAEKLRKPHVTAPYEERLKELRMFLNSSGLLGRAEIIPLSDPFGPTVAESCIEALVVSRETRPTAIKINRERQRLGLSPLKIITISMVPAENCVPISTTRVRKGEIDREGRLLRRSHL